MRTTLTLDKDVAAVLERLRKSRRESLKHLVNEALREGLRVLGTPAKARVPYRTESVDVGRCLLTNVDNVAEVLAIIEGEAFK